jgi:hypothetical protein
VERRDTCIASRRTVDVCTVVRVSFCGCVSFHIRFTAVCEDSGQRTVDSGHHTFLGDVWRL